MLRCQKLRSRLVSCGERIRFAYVMCLAVHWFCSVFSGDALCPHQRPIHGRTPRHSVGVSDYWLVSFNTRSRSSFAFAGVIYSAVPHFAMICMWRSAVAMRTSAAFHGCTGTILLSTILKSPLPVPSTPTKSSR